MAISGAAASPNQGYHSSPLVGLLMALFNVRLGWWLGNRAECWSSREGPRCGIVQIVQELFGLTTIAASTYICRTVAISRTSEFTRCPPPLSSYRRERCRRRPDCEFQDLGNAVRKVWIDFGVQIDFERIDIKKRDADSPGLYCAIGKIKYPERDAEKRIPPVLEARFSHRRRSARRRQRLWPGIRPSPIESTADSSFPNRRWRAIALWARTSSMSSSARMAPKQNRRARQRRSARSGRTSRSM